MSFKVITDVIDISVTMKLAKNTEKHLNLKDVSIYLTLLSRERLHFNSDFYFSYL